MLCDFMDKIPYYNEKFINILFVITGAMTSAIPLYVINMISDTFEQKLPGATGAFIFKAKILVYSIPCVALICGLIFLSIGIYGALRLSKRTNMNRQLQLRGIFKEVQSYHIKQERRIAFVRYRFFHVVYVVCCSFSVDGYNYECNSLPLAEDPSGFLRGVLIVYYNPGNPKESYIDLDTTAILQGQTMSGQVTGRVRQLD